MSILPVISLRTVWHDKLGLFVSLNGWDLPGDDNMPPKLNDGSMWQAFTPHFQCYTHVFSPLGMDWDALRAQVQKVPGEKRYHLSEKVVQSWTKLENQLFIILKLQEMREQLNGIPAISYPVFPFQHRYREIHRSAERVVEAAERAKLAFGDLSTLVTYVLSFWLTWDETCCFQFAFNKLSQFPGKPLSLEFLSHLENSHACSLEAGYRMGCIIDPYTSKWTEYVSFLVRARVGVYIHWGFDSPTTRRVDAGFLRWYPSESERILAKRRATSANPRYAPPPPVRTAVQLGLSVEHIEYPTGGSPDPSAIVCRGARQKPHETYELFFARMKGLGEVIRAHEAQSDRQRRNDNVKNVADGKKPKNVKVYQWINDNGFWRRTFVDPNDWFYEWNQVSPAQILYHREYNEIDLCPQLPVHNAANPPSSPLRRGKDPYEMDESDDEGCQDYVPRPYTPSCDIIPDTPESPDPPSRSPSPVSTLPVISTNDYANIGQPESLGSQRVDEPAVTNLQLPSLADFLSNRHGFDIAHIPNWHKQRHVSGLPRLSENATRVILHESTSADLSAGRHSALCDFLLTAANDALPYHQLPSSWDLPGFRLSIRTLDYEVIQTTISSEAKKLYRITAGTRSKGHDPWDIIIDDPVTLVQVFRSNWDSIRTVARGLLALGIPFHTAQLLHFDNVPPPISNRYYSRGLGFRPPDFVPTLHDYESWIRLRERILRSSFGRALRLRGGIVGRIARDFVDEEEILRGPAVGDAILCSSSRYNDECYVDDDVTEAILDIICGVYFVEVAAANEKTSSKSKKSKTDKTEEGKAQPNRNAPLKHLSYWPKQSTWLAGGLMIGQWSADAEKFYQERSARLREGLTTGKFELKDANGWSRGLKRYRPLTEKVVKATQNRVEEFLSISPYARCT